MTALRQDNLRAGRNDLPDPMSLESVRAIRLGGRTDKAAGWVLTDEMTVEATTSTPEKQAASSIEAKTKARAEKVAKIVEDAKATLKSEVTANGGDEVVKPSTRGKRKLTEDDVITIRKRAAEGVSNRIQSEEFRVTQTCIWNIINHKTWKHVK